MKKKYYLVIDTETATLPFSDEIAKNSEEKKRIAIARPLIYDIGWIVMDRSGNIVKKQNFLVQETFFVPNIFNTAYYKDKRPAYMKMLERGEIEVKLWNEIVELLLEDLRFVDITVAYNATFDLKKAIPFTERYIRHLYGADYPDWERKQRGICQDIAANKKNPNKNPDYLQPFLELRGERFPIADLWGISCEKLLNTCKYKNHCLANSLLTKSAEYFKSSAEVSFQYLSQQFDFEESHTALDDALIEAKILAKALKRGKIEPKIDAFPFRKLGTTFQYVQDKKSKYRDIVIVALKSYINEKNGYALSAISSYWAKMVAALEALENPENG